MGRVLPDSVRQPTRARQAGSPGSTPVPSSPVRIAAARRAAAAREASGVVDLRDLPATQAFFPDTAPPSCDLLHSVQTFTCPNPNLQQGALCGSSHPDGRTQVLLLDQRRHPLHLSRRKMNLDLHPPPSPLLLMGLQNVICDIIQLQSTIVYILFA